MGSECFICSKHRRQSGAQADRIFEDDLLYVGHVLPVRGPDVYEGWVVVEPKRHVPGLASLTDDEARHIGMMVTRVAKALMQLDDVQHVYSFVFGDAVPHLHVHVVPRYLGTPVEYYGPRIRDWPEAPRVTLGEVQSVCDRIRLRLRS